MLESLVPVPVPSLVDVPVVVAVVAVVVSVVELASESEALSPLVEVSSPEQPTSATARLRPKIRRKEETIFTVIPSSIRGPRTRAQRAAKTAFYASL
ncbi:MAG: hypothetical protein R3A79_12850 [Nannocystaceae bacterium]